MSDIVWKISRNELSSGEKLPSIEELARQHDVGRSTVREAIRYMESTGLIHSKHGKGTFILTFPPSENGIAFLDEIVDLRKMIEIHATRRAVHYRTSADIALLKDLLQEMKDTKENFTRFIAADQAFHGAIIKAAHNSFLPSIFQNVSGIYTGVQIALIHVDAKVADVSIRQHAQILKALEEQNMDDAVKHTDTHLGMIANLFRKRKLSDYE